MEVSPSAPERSAERHALADAIAAWQKLADEEARIKAAIDAWEGRAAARQHVEEAEARLDELHGEARDRRVQAALNPDAGIAQIGRDKIDDAEQAVDRARRELADLEETAAAMKKLAADPDRQARLQMAETAKEAAFNALVGSEAPFAAYLQGRRAAAIIQSLAQARVAIGLPAPTIEDLTAASSPWLEWVAALRRGEIDAPAPGF